MTKRVGGQKEKMIDPRQEYVIQYAHVATGLTGVNNSAPHHIVAVVRSKRPDF